MQRQCNGNQENYNQYNNNEDNNKEDNNDEDNNKEDNNNDDNNNQHYDSKNNGDWSRQRQLGPTCQLGIAKCPWSSLLFICLA